MSCAMTPLFDTSTKRQKGFSILEVMVAVVVLSLGLLGMASLQARALKGNQSSLQRSQATMLTYSILDAIRADRANSPAYKLEMCDAGTNAVQKLWVTTVKDTLGGNKDSTCASISCEDLGQSALCTIVIQWDDSAAGGSEKQTLETRTRI